MISCNPDSEEVKENFPTELSGKWIWQKSQGGFAGEKVTPKKDEIISREFINNEIIDRTGDKEVRRSIYKIEYKKQYGYEKFVYNEKDGEKAFTIENETLMLYDLCFDCYTHFYVRQK